MQQRELLREECKYSYSKDVLSVDKFLDLSLMNLTEFNERVEKSLPKRAEKQRDFKDQLDWLIDQHQRNVEQLKQTIQSIKS